MANNFPPGVTAKQGIVELGKSIAFSSLFDVFDLDPNSTVERVRFRDDGALATSGFFTVNGTRQNANQWVEIDYADISSVRYAAAVTIESESFNVQVYDGQFWSNVDNNILFSVTPNDDPAVITTETGSILAYEERSLDGLFTAADPDGYPIEFYYLVDRDASANGGYLTVNGIRKESGRWFRIDAEDLENVRYMGAQTATPMSETIGVMAFDGAQWTAPSDVRVHTIPNRHDPELSVFRTSSAPNRSMAFTSLSTWVDPDGNSAKRFGFLDNGTQGDSGFFTIDGVRQDSGRWITFDASIVDRVRYNTSAVSSEEEVFIGVYDGRYWSEPTSNTIASISRPVVDVTDRDLHFNELERVGMDTLFTQAGDPGPDFISYQVFDTNPDPLSGGYWIGSTELQNGVWHTLTPTQFRQLDFQSAESDLDRTTDELLVRGYNGRFWSEVERINATSDPVGPRSLVATNWDTLDNGTNTVITYSFIDGYDPDPPPWPPLPLYYGTDDIEANNTLPLAVKQRQDIRVVLNDFEKHLNIDFVEVAYDVSGPSTFTFGTAAQPANILGWAYLASNNTDGIFERPGDVWLNNAVPGYNPQAPEEDIIVGPGSSFRATVIHEVGHALGLKHPHEIPLPTLPISVDWSHNTVMSYDLDPAFHPEEPSTAMLWDIEQLKNQYGANPNFNPGNDHYFFPDQINLQALPSDSGGIDTLNFTNHLLDESIDLREGRRSSLNGQANALIIPYDVQIENARGGRGNDTIRGNEVRNLIWGNEGDDTLIGSGGNDLLRGGAGDDTYVWRIGDNRDTVREEGAGGTDIAEFHDNTERLNSLVDDFVFFRLGNDLRIDLTLDRGQSYGSMVIKDFENSLSTVETLRMFDVDGRQIDEDIDLTSVFVQADSKATRFRRTEILGANGFIAVPEV